MLSQIPRDDYADAIKLTEKEAAEMQKGLAVLPFGPALFAKRKLPSGILHRINLSITSACAINYIHPESSFAQLSILRTINQTNSANHLIRRHIIVVAIDSNVIDDLDLID